MIYFIFIKVLVQMYCVFCVVLRRKESGVLGMGSAGVPGDEGRVQMGTRMGWRLRQHFVFLG